MCGLVLGLRGTRDGGFTCSLNLLTLKSSPLCLTAQGWGVLEGSDYLRDLAEVEVGHLSKNIL